jgi:hypothetical protein
MAGLAEFEELDGGTPEQRASEVAEADRWRVGHGWPPLREWWEEKTEHLLHERASALGLLRRLR